MSNANPRTPSRRLAVIDQEDFRLLADGIVDDGVFMLDPEGVILTWNAGAQRMNGDTPDEIIGQHFSVFYSAVERAAGKPASELQEARATGRFEEEGWRRRQDGSRFWASVVITALSGADGAIRGFGKVTRDLSERKDAEDRYRMLVESVRDDAIITLDTVRTVLIWNVIAERIKGHRSADIIGTHFCRCYTKVDIDRDHPTTEPLKAAELIGFAKVARDTFTVGGRP